MVAKKIDDHTLQESYTSIVKSDESWYRENCLRREFNFLSRQCTTTVEFILWNKQSQVPGTSVSVTVCNFRDIEGQEEIARAHATLIRLGGHPPALENLLDKKPARLGKPTGTP